MLLFVDVSAENDACHDVRLSHAREALILTRCSPLGSASATLRWILFITWQTFGGSFAAVWIATIASKVTFQSIFQALQDKQTFAPLTFQNFQIFAHFGDFCRLFSKCFWNSTEIADFSVKISLIFVGISGNCRQLPEVTIFCTNLSKFARKWCKSWSNFDEQIHQFIKIC